MWLNTCHIGVFMPYMLEIVTQDGHTIDHNCLWTLLDTVKFMQSCNILIQHVIACDLSMWYNKYCNVKIISHHKKMCYHLVLRWNMLHWCCDFVGWNKGLQSVLWSVPSSGKNNTSQMWHHIFSDLIFFKDFTYFVNTWIGHLSFLFHQDKYFECTYSWYF